MQNVNFALFQILHRFAPKEQYFAPTEQYFAPKNISFAPMPKIFCTNSTTFCTYLHYFKPNYGIIEGPLKLFEIFFQFFFQNFKNIKDNKNKIEFNKKNFKNLHFRLFYSGLCKPTVGFVFP